MEKIIRSYQGEIRATADSRHIEGYACVFAQRSVLMRDWDKGPVYEQVEPGAITDALLRESDVIANINHDDDHMLARSFNGDGSLTLSIDDHGLKASFELPKTSDGDTVLEGVRRKDFRGMSFGFWIDPAKDVTYTEEQGDDGKTVTIRHINRIRGIFDVSVVTHPAYPTTEVEVRGIRQELEAALKKNPEPRSEEMKRDYDMISKLLNKNIVR